LAGLQFFLETAEHGDLLIIDEPELSAHPEAQVKLVELFALMIRAGIQIVLVTHSPYIVDHIINLLKLARLDAAGRASVADDLALKNPDAYLEANEVAVWHFGTDGQVKSKYFEDKGTIDWSTFADVSNRQSITKYAISDELKRGTESEERAEED
jgi:hypothetical protein